MKQPIRGWYSQLGEEARRENSRRVNEFREDRTAMLSIDIFPDGAVALYQKMDDFYMTSVHLKEGQEASEERAVKNLINRLYRELNWKENQI